MTVLLVALFITESIIPLLRQSSGYNHNSPCWAFTISSADNEVWSLRNFFNLSCSFSKKLAKVGKVKESFIERLVDEREEGKEKIPEIDRDIMFENAPIKNKDFIIAEKKKW